MLLHMNKTLRKTAASLETSPSIKWK